MMHAHRLWNAMLVLATLATPAVSRADIAYPSADTQISSAAPSTNYGNLPQIAVGGGSSGLVQFDLSFIPPGYTVTSARLTLFLNKVNTAGTLRIANAAGAWTEAGANYSNAPGITAATPVTLAAATSSTFVTVDVTALVAAQAAAANHGFRIDADTSAPSTSVLIDSKESSTTAHPALLEVGYTNPAATPAPLYTIAQASYSNYCNGAANCPVTVSVLANCPYPQYQPLTVLWCDAPASSTLSSTILMDPSDQFYAGCLYSGSIGSFINEQLSVYVLCAPILNQ
jgi:hypothetical protein